MTAAEPVTLAARSTAAERQRERPSGGMDRPVAKPRRRVAYLAVAMFVVVTAAGTAYRFAESLGVRALSIDPRRVTVATVQAGTFRDYVPVRGTVTPLTTVYLDAVEGGRVEKVLAEEGALVAVGQPIVELSNTTLQLDVISREAQVTEQINNLRNTRLAMEQNRLALERELVEIDYQIKRLSRLAERRNSLAGQGLIPRGDAEDTADELEYYRRRREVALESQAQDERMRQAQIGALEAGVGQLERNLEIARRNLENLVIKAPVAGQLTALEAERGASKSRGQRLGQIDDVENYKVAARIDEFYVTRLHPGQSARFSLAGREYRLTVDKVYPEVRDGQFQVDLAFTGGVPGNVRRGQTLPLEIALGEAGEALLLPTGAFAQVTGGNWAFVLDASGTTAVRRPITLGRRSPEHFEVLSGLHPGDRVIVSDYSTFTDMDRVELDL